MSHTCHANLCQTACRPEHLMCARHWRMVPEPLKLDVLTHYRPGQCADMRPSKAWFTAAKLAVATVAHIEGKPMSKHQRELLGIATHPTESK